MRKICMYQILYVPIWSALQNLVSEKEKKKEVENSVYIVCYICCMKIDISFLKEKILE